MRVYLDNRVREPIHTRRVGRLGVRGDRDNLDREKIWSYDSVTGYKRFWILSNYRSESILLTCVKI